jgi:HK97 family phage major capsid protein
MSVTANYQMMERRAKALNAARAVMSGAARANRNMLGTERDTFARAMDEFDRLGDVLRSDTVRYRDHELPAAPDAVADEYRSWVLTGTFTRSLQADADTGGGYLTAPTQMLARVLSALDDAVFVRGRATVHPPIKAGTAGLPATVTPVADAEWGTEIKLADFDNGLSFRGRALTPHPVVRGIRVSYKLAQAVGVETALAMVEGRLAQALAVPQERAFLTGDGIGKPLGLFTPSPAGVSTGRDVSAGNTATAITTAGLTAALFSLKAQFLPRAEWVLHRDVMRAAALLTDVEGNFLLTLRPPAEGGDLLLGRPVHVSEFAPSTFAAGKYLAVVGDLSQVQIVDSAGFEIQRLTERFAATNEVGLIARAATDSGVATEDAFARVQLAAA